jgi:feruloyl esterase
LQTGCGGLCGELNIRLGDEKGCLPATHGEVALASTNMGHDGGMGNDGSWGSQDYQLRVDFAYRGVHETALAAKALIAAYYGQGPKYSYFSGCSDGGREALMEAQRFPNDFNGITAGAAAMNFTTQNTFYHGYNVIANTGAGGKQILTADKLPILHQAALDACDAADGLKDDLISNPTACPFDPAITECRKGQDTQTCLTHAQVQVARDLYAGAHDGEGHKFVLSGPLPGSEMAWAGVLVPPPGGGFVLSMAASLSALKHLVYPVDPPASYTLKNLKLTQSNFEATTKLHSLYDATDPDLGPFAAAGGRLILWHGLSDEHISPLNSIAYYTAMQKLLGKEKVDEFARLYLFPGGYHCADGEGPFEFPLMAAIMAWVESNQAPNELIAAHATSIHRGRIAGVPGNAPAGALLPRMGPGGPRGPGAQMGSDGPAVSSGPDGPMEPASQEPGKIDRTRPVYPYPYTAKYIGTGSIDEAKNFVKGDAQPVDPARLEWLGSGFFTPHYERWCMGKGTELTCTATPRK